MVDRDVLAVVAARVDSRLVVGPLARINHNGQRPVVRQSMCCAEIVIPGNRRVSAERRHRRSVHGACVACAARAPVAFVRIRPLLRNTTVCHNIIKCKLVGRTKASAGSTAVLRVRRARRDLLLAQCIELSGGDGPVRLHRFRCGVSPARSALPLVLDCAKDGREGRPVVDRGREGKACILLFAIAPLRVRCWKPRLWHTPVETREFLRCPVGHVVDALLVRVALRLVEGLDLHKLRLEEALALRILSAPSRVRLAEVNHVLLECVAVQLVPLWSSRSCGASDQQKGKKCSNRKISRVHFFLSVDLYIGEHIVGMFIAVQIGEMKTQRSFTSN